MRHRSGWSACLLAGLLLVALLQAASDPGGPRTSSRTPPAQATGTRTSNEAAILVLDLPSGRAHSVVRPDLVSARIAPGSVLKIATLIAALEAGVITPNTRFTCRRRVTVDGHDLVCVHPDLGRPMSPAEALAHSCNDFFVAVGERLSRETLSATTASLGLGPIAPGASMRLAAVGLDGMQASTEQLLRALVRAVGGAHMRPETHEVLVEGLRGAATYGTARAIGEHGVDALAKTGTAPMPGGGYHGLALAVSPPVRPSRAVAVMLPGGSGGDAAAVAAEALAQLIQGTYGAVPIERPEEKADKAGQPAPGSAEAPRAADAAVAPVRAARPSLPAARVTPAADMVVRVGHARRGGYDRMRVPLEDYVARVLSGEAAPRSTPAVLQALAIAVRTFAVGNLNRHRAEGFDVCDLTHCQVMGVATEATREAAAATAGEILTYRGQPASIFYTACCGGQSELPSEVWPRAQDQPFLRRHEDRACGQMAPWTNEIAAGELLRALRAAGFHGDTIRDLRVARRSASGRAALLALDGVNPAQITGDDLRLAVGRTLGWQLLKSTAFAVERTSIGYRFTGRGSGHGVGLCVVGAGRMASEGKSAVEILAEYFPGTALEHLPAADAVTPSEAAGTSSSGLPEGVRAPAAAPAPSPRTPVPAPFPTPRSRRPEAPTRTLPAPTIDRVQLDVVLPASAEHATGEVQKLARRALGEISQRAGVSLPGSMRIVFHPTVESYSRQTKLPWWTAAAANGTRIDMLPYEVLDQRRIFEQTLRHEIAHVLTAPTLSGRPVWVKEGAAMYLSGEPIDLQAGTARVRQAGCPADDELLRSPSAASLRDAYSRAAACFSARIAAGKSWKDVE